MLFCKKSPYMNTVYFEAGIRQNRLFIHDKKLSHSNKTTPSHYTKSLLKSDIQLST